jgi:hypothetical protein
VAVLVNPANATNTEATLARQLQAPPTCRPTISKITSSTVTPAIKRALIELLIRAGLPAATGP